MKNDKAKDFVAYEYLSMNVRSEKEPLYIDCYENLGWMLISDNALVDKDDYYINNYSLSNRLVNIKFKRDRKINNKGKLLSLQRKAESILKEIENLEREPWTISFICSLTIGMIGTIFLAISVFAITAINPLYMISILTGAVGIIGWILPYFVYKNVKTKKEQENTSLIDKKYDDLYAVLEQAKKLSD